MILHNIVHFTCIKVTFKTEEDNIITPQLASWASLLQSGRAPDLPLGSLLVEFPLGLLLQGPDVIHRHPVPLVRPAEQLQYIAQLEVSLDNNAWSKLD